VPALLLWGLWLIVSAVVYSFASGIIHTYYTNTLRLRSPH